MKRKENIHIFMIIKIARFKIFLNKRLWISRQIKEIYNKRIKDFNLKKLTKNLKKCPENKI